MCGVLLGMGSLWVPLASGCGGPLCAWGFCVRGASVCRGPLAFMGFGGLVCVSPSNNPDSWRVVSS